MTMMMPVESVSYDVLFLPTLSKRLNTYLVAMKEKLNVFKEYKWQTDDTHQEKNEKE